MIAVKLQVAIDALSKMKEIEIRSFETGQRLGNIIELLEEVAEEAQKVERHLDVALDSLHEILHNNETETEGNKND